MTVYTDSVLSCHLTRSRSYNAVDLEAGYNKSSVEMKWNEHISHVGYLRLISNSPVVAESQSARDRHYKQYILPIA